MYVNTIISTSNFTACAKRLKMVPIQMPIDFTTVAIRAHTSELCVIFNEGTGDPKLSLF